MKVAIIQSNYLPWKGYFDIINDVDLFVFHDDLKYTKQDWRNRNQLQGPSGKFWITIPVGNKAEKLDIEEVRLASHAWQKKHWNLVRETYSRAPFFKYYADFFEAFYLANTWSSLSELNQYLTVEISNLLKIKTRFVNSGPFKLPGARTDKVINILKAVKASVYLSGPTAKNYIEGEKFAQAGINLVFKDYDNYPEYSQFGSAFDHHVSIMDLLFHTGPDAPYYIWGWRQGIGDSVSPDAYAETVVISK
jgi:hypothetical protein